MRTAERGFSLLYSGMALVLLSGCSGPQSTLQAAGKGAEEISSLFWWMILGGVFIWLGTICLAIYAVLTEAKRQHDRRIRFLIIGGGAVGPTLVLAGLLLYSLPMLPELLAPAPANALRIEVHGKMWWWRVRYPMIEGPTVELANEVRLPVGEPVEFQLASDDVIHSFWIPSLGGKIDMFPGRETRLKLDPTKTGLFRGACAEFCGNSHALMNFDVIVMEREEFELWLKSQQATAEVPNTRLAQHGQQLFLETGCHACHTVRGTDAQGVIGPDLTHVGSRRSLAAGALQNELEEFKTWISNPGLVKPGAKMPPFDMLPEDELRALATYLEGLQ